MSSVVVFQMYDQIFMGADSAVSAMLDDGGIYRLPQHAQKLFAVDDMVIFCAGTMELCDKVMESFQSEQVRTLSMLQQIAYKENFDYLERNPAQKRPDKLQLDIVVGKIEGGRSVVYSISPQDDHQLKMRVLDNPTQYAFWTGGIKTREANEKAFSTFGQTMNIYQTMQHTFDHIAFEGVGGELNVYRIGNDGIQHVLKTPIKEKPNMRGLNELLSAIVRSEFHLVVAEAVAGQLGNFVTMEIGKDNDVTKINTNGISAGHADFNSAPFRLDMKGNITANKLTANSAQIKSSNFTDGAIVGSSINVGNGMFTVDTAGNMFAGSGRFRGSIEASSFTGGSIKSNTDIDVTRDARIGNNLVLNGEDEMVAKSVQFTGVGSIYGDNLLKQLTVYGQRGVALNGGTAGVFIGSVVPTNRVVTVSDLQTKLDEIWDAINKKANVGHTHTVVVPDHNHGNPQNQNSGGGTFTAS